VTVPIKACSRAPLINQAINGKNPAITKKIACGAGD